MIVWGHQGAGLLQSGFKREAGTALRSWFRSQKVDQNGDCQFCKATDLKQTSRPCTTLKLQKAGEHLTCGKWTQSTQDTLLSIQFCAHCILHNTHSERSSCFGGIPASQWAVLFGPKMNHHKQGARDVNIPSLRSATSNVVRRRRPCVTTMVLLLFCGFVFPFAFKQASPSSQRVFTHGGASSSWCGGHALCAVGFVQHSRLCQTLTTPRSTSSGVDGNFFCNPPPPERPFFGCLVLQPKPQMVSDGKATKLPFHK